MAPQINFDEIPDQEDFQPLPADEYLCEVAGVRIDRTTNDGSEMWTLKMEVVEGEYQGRFVFDNLPFTKNAMKRIKLVCSRFGLPTEGKVNLVPEMFESKRAYVTVGTEEAVGTDGVSKERNVVPFAGYRKLGELDDEPEPRKTKTTKGTKSESSDLPF